MANRSAGSTRRRTGLTVGAAALALVVVVSGIIAGSAPRPGATASGGATSTPTTPAAAGNGSDPSGSTSGPAAPSQGDTVLPAGFSVRAGTATASAPTPVVTGDPLPAGTVSQIIGRLPAWSTGGLGTAFHWPAQSLTKPAAGKNIAQPFPAGSDSQNPPSTPVQTPTGPLRVLRMQPLGSVSVAPFVSITFSQPMVPVSTVGQLPDTTVPATITPAVAGHWDWIGTTTLRFSADSATVDRLPMATRFTVTVPAGTKSQSGGTLAAAAHCGVQHPTAGSAVIHTGLEGRGRSAPRQWSRFSTRGWTR